MAKMRQSGDVISRVGKIVVALCIALIVYYVVKHYEIELMIIAIIATVLLVMTAVAIMIGHYLKGR